ncbi:MAG: GNAT family N-acetyltransferase [Robiginitomaculum sp.]
MDIFPVKIDADSPKALAKIHAACFDAGWPASDFIGHIARDSDAVIGAYKGGALAGFIITRRAADQAEILTIAVAPDNRGEGFGAALLLGAEQAGRAGGAAIMFLDVAKDNGAALALYAAAGYAQCGTRPGYYRRAGGRVSAILFQKRL